MKKSVDRSGGRPCAVAVVPERKDRRLKCVFCMNYCEKKYIEHVSLDRVFCIPDSIFQCRVLPIAVLASTCTLCNFF